MLNYFRGAPTKIYLHKHLTHEYFHIQKFPDYGKTHSIVSASRIISFHQNSLLAASITDYKQQVNLLLINACVV